MAPRFSVSCSGLDVPRRTELTPSFLKHQAGGRHRLQFTHCPPDGALHLILVRKLQKIIHPSIILRLSEVGTKCLQMLVLRPVLHFAVNLKFGMGPLAV